MHNLNGNRYYPDRSIPDGERVPYGAGFKVHPRTLERITFEPGYEARLANPKLPAKLDKAKHHLRQARLALLAVSPDLAAAAKSVLDKLEAA